MNFNPTGDRVLIERAETETRTAGGLIIPDTSEKKVATKGKIVALGDGVEQSELVKLGNVAMFTQSYELQLDDKEYAVVNREDILGIFTE